LTSATSPAPKQGREADARSDVLRVSVFWCSYEMLTGGRVFDGESQAGVIAAILERPAPPISDVAPPSFDCAFKKCLAKDPEEQWRTVRGLKEELAWILSGEGTIALPRSCRLHMRTRYGRARGAIFWKRLPKGLGVGGHSYKAAVWFGRLPAGSPAFGLRYS
jgi:hypothetical protein